MPTPRNLKLARQPIVDRKRSLVGFELLFRSAGGDEPIDAREATADVIIGAFLELGIDKVLGDRVGFVNLDAQMLCDDAVLLLPKKSVVLELLETIAVNDVVIERARELSRLGYRLALDDVVTCDAIEPLLPLVDVVKVDVLALPPHEVRALLARIRARRTRPIELLAEKVETPEQLRACVELGFDLFQGYHFARPEVLRGRRLDRSRIVMLRLLSLVQSNASVDVLEDEIRHHPQIAYDLMRIVNSASLGLAESVTSLRQAIVVLGSRQLGRWIQLLVYGAAQGAKTPDHARDPVMQLAATRARLIELLAELERPGDRAFHDYGFLTGVLSLLDAATGATMKEICAVLRLAPDVERALLEREGVLGHLLALVEKLETQDHEHLEELVAEFRGLDAIKLCEAELAAFRWANEVGTPR